MNDRWRQKTLVYRRSRRRAVLLFAIFCLVFLPAKKVDASPGLARATNASGLVEAVNVLRAAYGLPALRVSNALMAAAQAQSEYQATIGTATHTGANGSRPHDRAVASGYGRGSSVFVSENIATGNQMSPQRAVEIWQGDAPHLNTMLSPNALDIGAGTANAGNTVYYTLLTGYVAGEGSGGSGIAPPPPGATSAPGSTAGSTAPAGSPAPTLAVVQPVTVATPRPDGAIIHEVEPGQALWSIADAYKINLADLLALNGMTDSAVIYPGEKLLVKAADKTPTITASEDLETHTPVPPTATRRPTRTATPPAATPTPIEVETPAPVEAPTTQALLTVQDTREGKDPLLVVIAVLLFTGASLVAAGSVLKRNT